MEFRPTTAYTLMTNRCNMRCTYCYEREFFKDNFSDMTLETANKVSDMILSNALPGRYCKPGENVSYFYFGGEPSLNWEVVKGNIAYNKELEKSSGYKFGLYFLTNAFQLPDDKDFFNVLRENEVRIQVSLDGCRKSHESSRGHFDEVVNNIKLITSQLGKHIIVRMTVTPYNIKYCYESFRLMNELACVVNMVLCLEDPWTDEDVETAREQFSKIMVYYKKLSYERGLFFNLAENCLTGGFRNCEAGGHMVGVDVNGDIYPCQRFRFHANKEWILGNVNTGITKRIDFSNMARNCDSCSTMVCHPCPSAFVLMNRTEAPEQYCKVYKALQETCYPIAKQVRDYNVEQVNLKINKLLLDTNLEILECLKRS